MTERASELGEASERLGRAVEAQLALARELDGLSRRQEPLLEREDAGELVGLLAERQRVVDALVALDAEVRRLGKLSGVLGAGRTGEASAQVASILVEVRARDERAMARLAERRDAVARELSELSAGRRAHGAYTAGVVPGAVPGVVPGARFQDREA